MGLHIEEKYCVKASAPACSSPPRRLQDGDAVVVDTTCSWIQSNSTGNTNASNKTEVASLVHRSGIQGHEQAWITWGHIAAVIAVAALFLGSVTAWKHLCPNGAKENLRQKLPHAFVCLEFFAARIFGSEPMST